VLTVILPLLLKKTGAREVSDGTRLKPAMFYFAAIGAGFMLVEIGLVQRLSVFLGHPIYALAVILFTVILSTGIGSSVSDKVREPARRTPLLGAAAAAAIVAVHYALLELVDIMSASSMPARIVASIAVIAPLGLLLGLFFPLGMRLAKQMQLPETAWLWALNGVFGVLASGVAVFIAIYLGISANFLMGAACYLLIAPVAATAYRRLEQAMAEREGFEPSKGLLSPYSLSRGALSTTQPPLRYGDSDRDGPRF
jgi:predicted membrane-bound spermidine synthase